MVQSVPGELSMDHSAILTLASASNRAYVSVSYLKKELNWEAERSQNALDNLVSFIRKFSRQSFLKYILIFR